ncbi:ribonuclease H-like domain-containing protein [Tanacetum coccineum]
MGVAQISNTVNDVGKVHDGVNSSPTTVTPGNLAVNKEDTLHDENDRLAPSKSTANPNKGTSYTNLFTDGLSRKAMNFHTLFTPRGNGVDVVVLVESIRAISERFANTAYGFFLGKRVAYLVFSSMEGLDVMLANGPWFIRNKLLILKKWILDVNLLKEDVGNVLIWVKLHGVYVTAFSEDGLSAIATKFGTPLLLNSYTSDMCIQSWGRSSNARALIKVRADVELKDNIVVAMLKLVREGFYTYECPKNIDSDVVKNMKKPSKTPRGVLIGPKVGFKLAKQVYRQVSKKNNVNTSGNKKKDVEPTIEDEVASVENDMANFLALKKVDYDDFSRFTWLFFLATKNDTSGILKYFITGIENLIDHKVKVIRCDNETELKNNEMNQFCEMKGILRQYSVARTPQQNRVAERRNRTLIEVARTMLVDSKLPTTFRAEVVNTTCYVQNRVSFGCPVTILNTIDQLGKFDGKADEGFFVGYSLNSKAFRVFNSRTRIVEENLHIRFSKNIPNVVGSGPNWLFDIDALTRTMNYETIAAGTQSNGFAGTNASDNAMLYEFSYNLETGLI